MTTSTGAVAERYAYTAYGQPKILNASGSPIGNQQSQIANRFTYTGGEWNETLGLHHLRARWMSPLAGRFLGNDPIGYAGSEWLLYCFVENRALIGLDPGGLCGKDKDDVLNKCFKEFNDCLAASVTERNRCIGQAAADARDFIRVSAAEALRQFNEADRVAALTRDLAIALCARLNDRNTLFGEIAYQSCVGVAYAGYATTTSAALAIYTAAEASIISAALAFEAGQIVACGVLYLNRKGTCDDELSACLRRGFGQ
jgi:RHS repeat-associated protein|nr:RHS repeat-associated core domain-containing protein [Pirellula sp.]